MYKKEEATPLWGPLRVAALTDITIGFAQKVYPRKRKEN